MHLSQIQSVDTLSNWESWFRIFTERIPNGGTQYSKNMPYEIICTFIHFLAIDPLNHNFKLKFVSSTVFLVIPDVIFSIDYNYINGQQVMPFRPNLDSCMFLYC